MTDAEYKRQVRIATRQYMKSQKAAMPEFSKMIIKTYSWACILWISASYVLAGLDRSANEGVTVAVISSLAAVLLTYFIKSLKENIAKNKKGDMRDEDRLEG